MATLSKMPENPEEYPDFIQIPYKIAHRVARTNRPMKLELLRQLKAHKAKLEADKGKKASAPKAEVKKPSSSKK